MSNPTHVSPSAGVQGTVQPSAKTAPLLPQGTPFSKRLAGVDNKTGPHERLLYDPSNSSLVIKDQMLFSVSASPVPIGPFAVTPLGQQVAAYLKKFKVKPIPLTTVFAGLPNPGNFEDVAILKVFPTGNQTVLSLVQDLRTNAKSPLFGHRDKVSPNHVMIPAPNELWCPYGPPKPVASVPPINPLGPSGVDITVIDSGYIWSQGWGPNPLASHTTSYPVHEADWLDLNSTQTAATWVTGTPNKVDANGDGKLDALAGHANFVAGVIAQHSEMPNIHIWNHNSAFAAKTPFDNFSTEAAICRSLVMSQLDTPTPVIQIGHASPFLGNIASSAWALAFARIGYGRSLNDDLVLTCPAGNQGLLPAPLPTEPRFPAYLNSAFPFVKGVASVNLLRQRSKWSNHGSWVVCSARGENVKSTFLHVNMPVEDDTATTTGAGASRNFKPNSWAAWNGTSFAAPKVAAAIAAYLSPTVKAGMAWQSLTTCADCSPQPGLGVVFSF